MIDPDVTIQSQYAASPTLTSLIRGLNPVFDPRADIKLFFDNIFNVQTAQGVGLDIWGVIVGASRTIEVEVMNEYFGFKQPVTGRNKPFDQAPFWEKGQNDLGLMDLSDDAFRALILWKAAANIATADAATLNRLMADLLEVPVQVHDLGNCTILITVLGVLAPYQKTLLQRYGLYPKGAAITTSLVSVVGQVFGFAGDEEFQQPFGQAPFFANNVIEL